MRLAICGFMLLTSVLGYVADSRHKQKRFYSWDEMDQGMDRMARDPQMERFARSDPDLVVERYARAPPALMHKPFNAAMQDFEYQGNKPKRFYSWDQK
ncbi:hypothetical protein AAVH_00597 [Aphelenchoides avenae]|nr:hypothetical protein AAVH_00597 [Aphelenchus avenae]